MNNKALKGVIIGAISCALIFIAFIVYMSLNWGIAKRDTYYVTASDGKKFKMSYILMNTPDLSCTIYLNYRGDKSSIDIWGEQTSKKVEMTFLYENNDFSYYRILHNTENPDEVGRSVAILSKNERMSIFTDGSFVECVGEDYLYKGELIEEIIPLAKYEVVYNNNADYIILYGDNILKNDNLLFLNVIKSYVRNPDIIKSTYYTHDEILAKCNELLQKYGGGQ